MAIPIDTDHWNAGNASDLRIDPYLVWAEATQWTQFEHSPNKHRAYSILLELCHGVDTQELLGIDKSLNPDTPALHIDDFYVGFRFIAASVRKKFFQDWADRCYHGAIERFELCEPVTGYLPISGSRAADPVEILDSDAYKNALRQPGSIAPSAETIVGVIDYGCAFANREYCYGERYTRVIALWDQNVRPEIRHPDGVSRLPTAPSTTYGAFLGEKELNEAIARKPAPQTESWIYSNIAYRAVSTSVTHGSHVLSIAGGERADPGREFFDTREPVASCIGFVQLPERALDGAAGLWLGKLVLDGLHFLRELLPKEGMQLVANVSFGPLHGPHDGSSLLEQAMIELLDRQPNMAITLPAGNAFLGRSFACLDIPTGQAASVGWHVLPDSNRPSFVEVWLPEAASKNLVVRLVPPSGCRVAALEARNGEAVCDDKDYPRAAIIFPANNSRGSGAVALLVVGPTTVPVSRRASFSKASVAGRWTIELEGDETLNATVKAHIYVARNDVDFADPRKRRQSYLVDEQPLLRYSSGSDPEFTGAVRSRGSVSGIATAGGEHQLRYHVVAGHINPDRSRLPDNAYYVRPALYSSSGPSRDGADAVTATEPTDISPNIPGVLAGGVHSARIARLTGTSSAAPRLARRIAHGSVSLEGDRVNHVPESNPAARQRLGRTRHKAS